MHRLARIVFPGVPHHVTQRGNNRQTVFFTDDDGPPRGVGRRPESAPGEVVDIGDQVERFVLAMRDSKLDEAERVAGKLKRVGPRARDYVEGALLDPTPPPIPGVPKPLVQGFLKALLERLG